MNQTFDFQRFLLTLRLEIAEKGRNQLLMAAVLVGGLLLMMLPIMFSKEYSQLFFNLQLIALVMLVLFGGSLYTAQVFGQYNSTNSTIVALMVPASRLEKFLSTLLINLAFIVPFILLFLGLHIWTTDFANNNLLPDEKKYEKLPEEILYAIILVVFVIQGVAFLGAIYFTKASYIKTAAALLVLTVFGATANHYIVKSMVPSATYLSAYPFSSWQLYLIETKQSYYIDLPKKLVGSYFYILPILVVLSILYITYVRLAEKEV